MPSRREPLGQVALRLGLQWFGDVFRILRQLWLEVTGGIFLALAAFGVPSAIREWRLLQQDGSWVRFAMTVLFIGMMAGFGVYSFWKSRRVR
jgi:hypothetical protein